MATADLEGDDEEAESESESESDSESDEGESADEEEKKRNAELIQERIELAVRHVPTHENVLADAGTRQHDKEFRGLAWGIRIRGCRSRGCISGFGRRHRSTWKSAKGRGRSSRYSRVICVKWRGTSRVEAVWSSDVVDGTHSAGPPWQSVYGEN